MLKQLSLFAAVLTVAFAGAIRPAFADELNVGDPAPKLEVKEFVKGNPVTAFEKGKVYVVEFWATWCGPCRATIPHLTELQKKYQDVKFVGVSVWETDQNKVKPFVSEMGPKMDYAVAMDVVPDGARGNDGVMAKSWMTAAGQNGIPTAFVVNGDGKVAWIGHPMELEKPLEMVVAGKWDVEKEATAFKERANRERKMMSIQKEYMAAARSGDMKKAVGVLDAAIAEDASMEQVLGMAKYSTLLRSGDATAANTYMKHLIEDTFKDDSNNLNSIAWSIVDPAAPKKPTKEQIALALTAAKRADKLTGGKDGAIGDTLAKAYFDSGNVKMALATQEKAVASMAQKDPEMVARLEMYRKAAKKP